jgi:pyruvate kinase
MDYDIIATLGPSSASEVIWRKMLSAGVTGFRLNTSHMSLDQVQLWVEKLLDFREATGLRYPVVLDLQGSKWRLGQFTPHELKEGQEIRLVYATETKREQELPVPHLDFFSSVKSSAGNIYLNDAKVCLAVLLVEQGYLLTRVTRGGPISPGKGITCLDSDSRKEAMTGKDQALVDQTRTIDPIRYAISYVRDAAEMSRYRTIFGSTRYLIAKLERKPALEQVDQIAEVSNELWLCRGDLGAEIGDKAMAEAVHQFSKQVRNQPVPVILAGQVLEHMTTAAAPTRSEVCFLYGALEAGYQGFVLSDETSIGHHPLASCRAAGIFRTERV